MPQNLNKAEVEPASEAGGGPTVKANEADTPDISEANVGNSEISQPPGPLSKEQHEHERRHRLRKHLQNGDTKSKKELKAKREVLVGVNLRDIGAVCTNGLQQGRVFRSSELLSKDEMERYGMKTILDLRRMDRPCKKTPEGDKVKESFRRVLKYLILGPQKLVPEKLLPYTARAHYNMCPLCHERCEVRFGRDMNVVHADLIPSTVGLRIFQAMPWRVQLKALLFACIPGRGAASVMAPAVANPLLLGYKALYRTLLEDSKRGMAQAMRVFVDDTYPILVHCIHGKDRTGLIIMLLLLLCDVDPQAIVDDYVMSEAVLKESRMHDELDLDVYLTSDDVIAATRDTMEETIAYVKDKYVSAAGYLHEIGLEDWEIAKIRVNLMAVATPADIKTQSSLRPRRSIFGFYRRASGQPENLSQMRSRPGLSATSLPIPPKPQELGGPRLSAGDGDKNQEDGKERRSASVAVDGSEDLHDVVSRLRDGHFASIAEEDGERKSASAVGLEGNKSVAPLDQIKSGQMGPPKSPFGGDDVQQDKE